MLDTKDLWHFNIGQYLMMDKICEIIGCKDLMMDKIGEMMMVMICEIWMTKIYVINRIAKGDRVGVETWTSGVPFVER